MITSYKELPVGKYLELESIVLGYPDDVERNTLVLSVLTGKTPKELMNIHTMPSSFIQADHPATVLVPKELILP